jgi:opacity protein-like surface antigen
MKIMGNSMFNNKQRNSFYMRLLPLFLMLFSFMHMSVSHAVCGMDEDDDYYGNAETCPFKNAVESTVGLTPEDQAFLNAVEATRIINRWYARLYIGKPKFKLNEISNTSLNDFVGFTPAVTSITNNLTQVTLAGGYFWEQWALEFEVLFSKKFNFTMSPVYVNAPVNVTGDVNSVTGFLNVQYVVPRLFSWYPRRLQIHFDAGVGPSLKMTNLNTFTLGGAPQQSGSTRTIAAATNLGAGARYQISAHWLVDVAYRYFFLGKTNFGPAIAATQTQVVQFQSEKTQVNGWFIGALYQF